jgi:hypothetical protein
LIAIPRSVALISRSDRSFESSESL